MTDGTLPTPPPCSRCGTRPPRSGQRWCGACHAAYKREQRARRRVTGRETARASAAVAGAISAANRPDGVLPAASGVSKKSAPPPVVPPDPPAPYTPFEGLPPQRRPAWCDVYLRDLAARGLPSLAAAKAGVHRAAVRDYRSADDAFDAEIDVAHEYYRDFLEWESVTLGRTRNNPLPYFARLKAERPARYLDRAALVVASTSDFSPAAGRALLATMLGHATDATRQALRALPAVPIPPEPPPE